MGFEDQTSQASDGLVAVTLATANDSTSTQTGILDRANDIFSLCDLPGTIDTERTEVALDDGGVVVFDPVGNTFSVRFTATPLGGDQALGVVGIPSATDGISGTVAVTDVASSRLPTPPLTAGHIATVRSVSVRM